MINDGGAGNTNGGGMEGGGTKMGNVQGLKKGPWTAAEDAILIEYVKKHGEGNWNSVQKNSGLMRCGKSCRLRWANHLRPNLKKGSFTPEEERIIIELHAKLGNKWARMASHLPGRTDNEIKNFWNTRMKRRQRAGLPIYPQEFQEEANVFHLHQQQDQLKRPNSSPSSSPFSNSLLSSSRKVAFNNDPSLSLLDHPISFQNHLSASFFSNPTFQIKSFSDNNGNSALPLSPPCSSSFYQSFPGQAIPTTPPPSLGYNTTDLENMSFTSLIMGAQVEPIGQLIQGLKSELPSNQITPRPNTHFPSNTSVDVCLAEESSKNTDNDDSETAITELQDNRNSGLLDALLLESRNLSSKEKFSCENKSLVASDKRKQHEVDEPADEEQEDSEDGAKEASKRVKLSSTNAAEASCENHYSDDMASSQSSIGIKPSEEPINSMDDDDLSSFLDNFPSSTPLPDWYRRRNMLNETKPTSDGRGHEEDQREAQPTNAAEDATNVEWAFGSSYWNNMPSIC